MSPTALLCMVQARRSDHLRAVPSRVLREQMAQLRISATANGLPSSLPCGAFESCRSQLLLLGTRSFSTAKSLRTASLSLLTIRYLVYVSNSVIDIDSILTTTTTHTLTTTSTTTITTATSVLGTRRAYMLDI